MRIIDGDYSRDDDGTTEHQDNSYLEEPVHSAWEALPGAVRTLEQQTADHIPQDQIKEQWNSFLNDLQSSYPESADAVKDLQSATANITTEQEWKELINALRRNIDSSSSSTEGAHDNQATWLIKFYLYISGIAEFLLVQLIIHNILESKVYGL